MTEESYQQGRKFMRQVNHLRGLITKAEGDVAKWKRIQDVHSRECREGQANGTKKILDKAIKKLDELRQKFDLMTFPDSNIVIVKKRSVQCEGCGAAIAEGNTYCGECQIEKKVKQAFVILESCDYKIHPELEFVYGWFGDKNVMARVSLPERKVFISQALLQKPLFYVISTLIEENEHFNTGMQDKTREFDLYTRQLLATNAIEI